jgi:NADH:ubiquinone oxidoreductase subunit 6 (subunit J)
MGPYYHLNTFRLLEKGQTAGSLGLTMLRDYPHLFFLSGIILFLALIGALSITQIQATEK